MSNTSIATVTVTGSFEVHVEQHRPDELWRGQDDRQACELRGMSTGLEALEFAAYAQSYCATTEDHKEGVAAFFEKKQASFTGR